MESDAMILDSAKQVIFTWSTEAMICPQDWVQCLALNENVIFCGIYRPQSFEICGHNFDLH